ncbi:hypothetical protein [Rhizobium rhizogenes]|uniref:hypothetical protein n=1 Tax=Rhizobium rhizogenes TaxID=359 RepID=UPI001572E608|nr:hypothetical protein [Rhizobium rhizogenes]
MRKEIDITITETGRDLGKTYHIREMPALRAEKWATRAFLAVAKSGVDIGQVGAGGMQALAILGLEALMKLHFEDAEPLLDEMLECISIKPNPENPAIVRLLMEDDIEEVKTLFQLRKEVLGLHLGFSQAASPSTSTSGASALNSSNTPTSQDPSVRFSRSPRAKQPR